MKGSISTETCSTVTCSVGTQPVRLGGNPNPAQVQTVRVPAGYHGRVAGRATTIFHRVPE